MYENNFNIVHTVLENMNEKIKSKLNTVHSNYSLMPQAIRLSQRDKDIATPIMDKWIPRVGDLKLMAVGVSHQKDRYPRIILVYKFVDGIREKKFQGYVAPLEQKIKELKSKFDEVELVLLLDI